MSAFLMILLGAMPVVPAGASPGASAPPIVRAPSSPSPPAKAHGQEVAALVKTAGRALVLIRTFGADGSPLALGSGFFVGDGRVVTNAHVIAGAARAEIHDFSGQLVGVVDHAESLSTAVDIAILPALKNPSGILALADVAPEVGENLVVLGAPEGLSNTVSTGILSAVREYQGRQLLQMSAPVSHGSSGGPVLDMDGNVVGVTVALLAAGENLNFAVPARDVLAILNSPRGHYSFLSARPPGNPSSTVSRDAPSGPTRVESQEDKITQYPRLELGQPVSGELTKASAGNDGRGVAAYSIVMSAGEVVTLIVVSKAFDAMIGVTTVGADGKFKVLGSDDDGLDGRNPRLVVHSQHDGPCLVLVSSAQPNQLGSFRVGAFEGDQKPSDQGAQKPQPRWEVVSSDKDGVMSLDRLSFQALDDGSTAVWMSTKLNVKPRSHVRYDSYKQHMEFDCAGRRLRILEGETYLGDRAISEIPESDWSAWIPESIGESVGLRVCGATE